LLIETGTDKVVVETKMDNALAFIAFLHCEAALAEERAKSLRVTAATIAAQSEISKSPAPFAEIPMLQNC
jgi:hypothetical protein